MKKIFLIGIVMFAMSACNREFKRDKDTTYVNQESRAERLVDEVGSIVDEAAASGSLEGFKIDGSEMILADGCAEVILDTLAFPRTVTVDFGEGCIGNDGKTRKGKIMAHFTGPYRSEGTVITISTDNYFVQGHQISGNPLRVIENQGLNAEGHPAFSINVTGIINFANNGGSVNWSAQRTREWTEGFNTFLLADDRYKITGSAVASNTNDISWNSTITNPLIVNMGIGCRQIVSGTILTTSDSRPDREVDFGNGACDNQLTVTVNGNTYTVMF